MGELNFGIRYAIINMVVSLKLVTDLDRRTIRNFIVVYGIPLPTRIMLVPWIRYMVYNGYYKVMSNIPKMGHLTTPVNQSKIKRIYDHPEKSTSQQNPTASFSRQNPGAIKLWVKAFEWRFFFLTFSITLWWTYKKQLKMAIYSGFSPLKMVIFHCKMLVHQRVTVDQFDPYFLMYLLKKYQPAVEIWCEFMLTKSTKETRCHRRRMIIYHHLRIPSGELT